jgi:hypothetical protein
MAARSRKLESEVMSFGRGVGHEFWTTGIGAALWCKVGRVWSGSGSYQGDAIIAVPLRASMVRRTLACRSVGWVHFDIGRRGRPRCSLLIALAVRIGDAQIVLGMLIEIFRGDAVAADRGLPREANVPLKYLIGAPPNLHIGAAAFEEAISL